MFSDLDIQFNSIVELNWKQVNTKINIYFTNINALADDFTQYRQ